MVENVELSYNYRIGIICIFLCISGIECQCHLLNGIRMIILGKDISDSVKMAL